MTMLAVVRSRIENLPLTHEASFTLGFTLAECLALVDQLEAGEKAATELAQIKVEFAANAQHVYQHAARDADPLINTEVERNSRGFNWKCNVTGARNIEEALRVSEEVMNSLARMYGTQNAELAASKPLKVKDAGRKPASDDQPEEL